MTFRIFALLLAALVLTVGWAASCVLWRAAELNELVGPVTPRSWDELTVITVGTGSPYENPERLGPATGIGWLNQVLLVDVGRGTAEGLRLAKIPVSQPSRVLLTSLMPESTLGLDDLLFTGWRQDRAHPLQIVGPTGTRAFVEALLKAYQTGQEALQRALLLPNDGIHVEVIEANDGFRADWDGLSVSAVALTGGPTPGLAWRFEAGGRAVVVGRGRGTRGRPRRPGATAARRRAAHLASRHWRAGEPVRSREPGADSHASSSVVRHPGDESRGRHLFGKRAGSGRRRRADSVGLSRASLLR
jgi:hypothetical protein